MTKYILFKFKDIENFINDIYESDGGPNDTHDPYGITYTLTDEGKITCTHHVHDTNKPFDTEYKGFVFEMKARLEEPWDEGEEDD